MTCLIWTRLRSLLLALPAVAGMSSAQMETGRLHMDFAAAVPSGTIYAGTTVDLIATMKITTSIPLTRRQLVNQAGFNPTVAWEAKDGSFASTSFLNGQGDSTSGPNGVVFVSRGTYRTPPFPGTYVVYAVPASDPARRVELKVVVENPPLKIQPSAVTLGIRQHLQFRTSASPGSYVWRTTGGEINADGLYRAPMTVGTYQVTVQSVQDAAMQATATVTVGMPSMLLVVPEELTIGPGQTQQFTAIGLQDDPTASWSVSPPSAGTITHDGLFTAGSQPGLCSVLFLSDEMGATVSVDIISAHISPDPATTHPGGTIQFSVEGLPAGAPVSWAVQPAGAGTISGDGRLTAGNAPGSCRVSASAGGIETSIMVRILAARIRPEEALTAPGATIQFTMERFGPPSTHLTWKLLGDQPGASLDQDGLYRAPSRQGVYRIAASDAHGAGAQATITVGPPAGLLISPEIVVEEEGVYTVCVQLKASNGRRIESNFTGVFQPGKASPEIVFPIQSLQRQLGVDGPYAVERVSIHGTAHDQRVVFDVREDLGLTEALRLSEAGHKWVHVPGAPEISTSTDPGSGLIEALFVSVPVELTSEGTYRIQATLTTEDGTEIETFSGQQEWTRGLNSARLRFDGRRLRARGVSGPLSILRFRVDGPATGEQDFPRLILGYDFRMFAP